MSKKELLALIGVLYALGTVALFTGFWLNEGAGTALIALAAACAVGVFILGISLVA